MTQIILLLITLLVVPAVLLYALWRSDDSSKFAWLIKVIYTGAFIAYLFLVGRWDFVSIYLRWVWVVLYPLAVFVSYRAVKDAPFFVKGGAARNLYKARGGLLPLVLFLFVLGVSLRGFFYSGEAAQLAFPLRDGRYYIAHGGNSTLVNAHNRVVSQRYALDIIALNPVGLRASGLLPADNEQYVVFDAAVYAPCDGQVTAAVDGLPDLTPPQMDQQNPPGNHVAISCPEADVIMAHLRNGSVMVRVGDLVSVGQPLGRVGNSGNTSEPHLHMHATRPGTGGVMTGEGMPMLFDGRFLVRNAVFEP